MVDAGHDVAIVAAAPILDVRAHELLAVVRRAPRVGIEDRPPLAGPELAGRSIARLEARAGHASGTSVRLDDERITPAGLVADRLDENPFHGRAVRALPSHDLGLS